MSESPSSADTTTRGCVASIGAFDGVHRGQQALIRLARERADLAGIPLVVVTFDPHPLSVVGAGAPTSLATLGHRVELLLEAGADEVDVLEFNAALAAVEAEDFVRETLVDRLRVHEVVVGHDFRFGHRARGSIDTLRAEGERWGFGTTVLDPVGSGGVRWSSTLARTLITEGDVRGAAQILGRHYRIDGRVVHGDHRGRELGYPTANLAWEADPTIPADGVYAGWLETDEHRYQAAVSVGTNPQFEGRERRVESYVLDRDDLDLYGAWVGVSLVDRIRGQRTFQDLDGLIARMAVDVARTRTILAADD